MCELASPEGGVNPTTGVEEKNAKENKGPHCVGSEDQTYPRIWNHKRSERERRCVLVPLADITGWKLIEPGSQKRKNEKSRNHFWQGRS